MRVRGKKKKPGLYFCSNIQIDDALKTFFQFLMYFLTHLRSVQFFKLFLNFANVLSALFNFSSSKFIPTLVRSLIETYLWSIFRQSYKPSTKLSRYSIQTSSDQKWKLFNSAQRFYSTIYCLLCFRRNYRY